MTPEQKLKKKTNDKRFLEKNPNYYKEYRLKHREKQKLYMKEYMANSENKTKKLNEDKKRYFNNKEQDLIRRRNAVLKSEFGITRDDYNRMLNEQNNVCAICFKPEYDKDARTKKIKSLAVDHCHDTGKVRGLLCRKCNTAIGLFQEDINIINNCVNYLQKER